MAARESEEGRSSATHTVESGETLSHVARKYDVSVEALQEENDLSGSTIRVGQELRIPTGARREAASAASKAAEHVVRNGETLWAIARQYGSTVSAIQDANELGERPIRPGQKLTIPVLN